MQLYTIYTKGLGNADVYARIHNCFQWWDFTAQTWSATETPACHLFLTEFSDATLDQSWYYGTFTPPSGGPFPIQIMSTSLNMVIGNDLTWIQSAQPVTGSVRCAEILLLAARQLQDVANITWPPAILMAYLNYAVREIVNLRPEANTVISVSPLVAGTRQQVPSSWNILLDVKRNMGAGGNVPGRAITRLHKTVIEAALPDWHSWPAATEVRHAIQDERDPYYFDVFPPQPANTTQQVELLGSTFPAKVSDPVNDYFPLTADYEVAACDYMVYRALNEATTIPNALNKAQAMLNKFYQSLGVKSKAEAKSRTEEAADATGV